MPAVRLRRGGRGLGFPLVGAPAAQGFGESLDEGDEGIEVQRGAAQGQGAF